jgi:hypothetical protein
VRPTHTVRETASRGPWSSRTNRNADVMEHPEGFLHVGLLFNKPPGRFGLLFIESSDRHSL